MTMQRRPFIKLLGSSLLSLPFVSNVQGSFNPQTYWQVWLEQVVNACQIEAIDTSFYSFTLPSAPTAVLSGEFCPTNTFTYFYNKGQYCFQVFAKTHPIGGVLSLMIPFWKRQSDGSWAKITCLSNYDLEALAQSSQNFTDDTAAYVLPLDQVNPATYITAKGEIKITSHLCLNNTVNIHVQVWEGQSLVWQKRFVNKHPPSIS